MNKGELIQQIDLFSRMALAARAERNSSDYRDGLNRGMVIGYQFAAETLAESIGIAQRVPYRGSNVIQMKEAA